MIYIYHCRRSELGGVKMLEFESPSSYPRKIGTGFLCGVHLDDVLAGGRITRLANRLEKAVQLRCGGTFPIVRASKDVFWEVRWETVMRKALNETSLLFPVVTPAFFNSEFCCREVLAFSTIKSNLRGLGLIFPIYFVDADLMESETARTRAPAKVAKVRAVANLVSTQYEDWRELRLGNEGTLAYEEAIDRFAQRIAEALSSGAEPD
jgi:hypothetical protein